ncbi:unnamed protein product [Rhizoctonia solani]|uniref:Transmembrane protein n=1 Tax=Rhizoctonia solani TaxID=456999 RepID=A0A8H3ATW2_9AGAM|nr:unnamed protein product [Rhizoctonia solani]
MPYNVTIDDISPLITYKGQWTDAYRLAADPYTNRYLGQTFHSSRTDGSQASFKFNGTAVWIFGAKRGNHGHFIVTIDNGDAQRIDGYAPEQSDGVDGVYQVAIFSKTGLEDKLHTVTLTNDNGSDGNRPYVDIDFITWTSNDDLGADVKNITMDDYNWNYTSPSAPWGTTSSYVVDYFNQTEHLTNVGGATASVQFQGNAVYLYGGTLDDHGTFNVQLDDHNPVGLNGSTNGYHSRALLYYADGLGPGNHKLTVTNTQDGRYLDVDYIQILQSSATNEASQSNPGGHAKTPIIAGTVCGVVIGLAWIIAAVWWFMKRRKRRADGADLLNAESKPYDAPPVGYGPASSGPGWDGQSSMAQTNQPWANDPAYTATYQTQSQTTYPMSMYPPSSVSGSGNGSTGAPSAYGGAAVRPDMPHQQLSTLTQEDETDPRVHEMVPPPDPKGRAPLVVNTGHRGDMTEDELRTARMQVPERAQDWGPLSDTSADESTGILPPDYHQATEPFPNRRGPPQA